MKSREYRAKNRDKVLATERAYIAKNREKIRAVEIRWRKNNAEHLKEYRKEYFRLINSYDEDKFAV